MGTKRGGHIPGAVHLEWTKTIDPATKRFRPAPALREMFERLGATLQKEMITYCQGGIRAAHTVLALRLAGFEKVRNYDGSWAEWGNLFGLAPVGLYLRQINDDRPVYKVAASCYFGDAGDQGRPHRFKDCFFRIFVKLARGKAAARCDAADAVR